MDAKPIAEEINAIINALKKTYKKSQREIEMEMGYSEDYISGELSKGGNKTLLKKLKKYQVQLEERAKNPSYEVLDIVKEMRVKVDIMFSEMVVRIANDMKQPITVTNEQYQKMVKDKLEQK